MTEPIRVLLIEDSADDALLAARALERGGLRVHTHSVATMEGLETALRGGSWDVILSDHSMPGFDALSAMTLVRRVAPDVPFLLVSGTIGEERAVAAIKAGALAFFGDKYGDRVRGGLQAGTRLGVSSTPSVFINGRLVRGAQSYEAFEAVIEDELERTTRR